jgi:hypothetical protein
MHPIAIKHDRQATGIRNSRRRATRRIQDGVIVQECNTKLPHSCGEALMQKNRSDLALSNSKRPTSVAPNWGRLYLK